ncbi:hypothetical protein Leryth_024490 [Lithospermum erythrorhizon]|nr:hypothetical protein Leryth_024490 [Lithospermum erythrorhizon]
MAFGSSHLLFIFMIVFTTFNLISIPSHSLPFVVFHGIADQCSNDGVSTFTELLSNWSEIGNGERDSWFMPFMDQTSIACEKVKQMSELKDGYTIIGLSQGNMVGRGVLEFCDDGPSVKNFISLAGPHAGEASIPFCGEKDGLGFNLRRHVRNSFMYLKHQPSFRIGSTSSLTPSPSSRNVKAELDKEAAKQALGWKPIGFNLAPQFSYDPRLIKDDSLNIQNTLAAASPHHKQHPSPKLHLSDIREVTKIRNRPLPRITTYQAWHRPP